MSGKCSGVEEYQNVISLFYSNTLTEKKRKEKEKNTQTELSCCIEIPFLKEGCALSIKARLVTERDAVRCVG